MVVISQKIVQPIHSRVKATVSEFRFPFFFYISSLKTKQTKKTPKPTTPPKKQPTFKASGSLVWVVTFKLHFIFRGNVKLSFQRRKIKCKIALREMTTITKTI